MAPTTLNPYYDHDAVRDLSMFFGRQEELEQLYNALEKRQCCSILGPRHIGKSSVLKYLGVVEVQQRAGYHLRDRLFVITDCREYLQKTREEFFRAMSALIIASSQSVLGLEIEASTTLPAGEAFKKVLEEVRKSGYRTVMLLDAFDHVTRNTHFDGNFFTFLRSLAGVTDLISYVTASIKPLREVTHSQEVASSPFFNIFLPCALGPLTEEEALQLITAPAQHAGLPFAPAEVSWVQAQAGRHPFFVQVACRHLFSEKLRRAQGEIDLKQVQDDAAQELQPHFDSTWNELTEDQQQTFRLEAARPATDQVRRKLPELSESSLFRRRIRELLHEETPEITLQDVREALVKLEENAFLGACKLSEMHYVVQRIGNEATPSTGKRGILVRDFLKTAFDRMRPGETRSDGAPEWRLYNILWYHYFRYHLPNPQTAARLGISSARQFYREQDRAIQALLQELLDMEAASMSEGQS